MPILRAALCVALIVVTAGSGCTYYQAVPAAPSGPSTFERSWNAALGAADDVGVAVSTADRTSGTIYGTTGADDVTIRVFTQADGRVRVEFNVKGAGGSDAVMAERLSSAYNRRMGR
jgi:hypothetical protein